MTEIANDKMVLKTAWINALKTFAKILVSVLLVFCFLLSVLFLMAPKADAKIFEFLGLKKAEESCYIRIYERSQAEEDLYNLIMFESKEGETLKQLQYINMLLSDGDYEEFCIRFNNSAVVSLMNEKGKIEKKNMVAHVCNINSYLLNQKVNCMVNLGFENENVWNFIASNLEKVDIFEYSITTYLNLIETNTSISNEKAKQLTKDMLSYEKNSKTIETLLNERIDDVETYLLNANLPDVGRIIALNTMVNLRLADYRIDVLLGDDSTASKDAYVEAFNSYKIAVG